MTVTKRTRYEVLRRDNFTCRYCRNADGELTIDHVTPVALGGTDEPSNLVACCKDCNAGKTSTSPSDQMVSDVAEDALRWQEAMRQAIAESRTARGELEDRFSWFTGAWESWDEGRRFLPDYWLENLREWDDIGLDESDVLDALEISMRNRSVGAESVFIYMRGIIRNRVAKATARAHSIMEADGAP